MPTAAPKFRPKFAKTIKELNKLYDDSRGSANDRGYTYAWTKVRAMKLSANPLCEMCESKGKTKIADMVHHIREISAYPDGRLELANLQSLCWEHHSQVHSRQKE